MSEYITTYTGKYFNPTQPNPDLISIQDIGPMSRKSTN